MKTHYELLGVPASAPPPEIKHAFRREIARYHPDKVQHLGPEFREIADARAAELTEAYRVLMDEDARRTYDDGLRIRGSAPAGAIGANRADAAVASFGVPAATGEWPAASTPSQPLRRSSEATSDLIRKATIERLRFAIDRHASGVAPAMVVGFDAACVITPRKALFRRAEPRVRLLARFVQQVDALSIRDAWRHAVKSGAFDGVVCLMLLGRGLSPPRDLGAAIAEQRRRTRTPAPIVVSVDVRDWEALLPPDTPVVVRHVVDSLRAG